MKKVIILLLVAFIFCNDSSKAQNDSQKTDTVQTKSTDSDLDKSISAEDKDRAHFIVSCIVDANAGNGLDAGRKKMFCECLWEKSKGDAELKKSEAKGCMEKVQKLK